MSTPSTCQPCAASQRVSPPSPQPRSSARPGDSAAAISARGALTCPLQIRSRSAYLSSQCCFTSDVIFPPSGCEPSTPLPPSQPQWRPPPEASAYTHLPPRTRREPTCGTARRPPPPRPKPVPAQRSSHPVAPPDPYA